MISKSSGSNQLVNRLVMKKLVYYSLLFAALSFIAGSCSKMQTFGKKGERIHFSAGSISDATKTIYGDVDGNTQAINWEVGDLISIAGKNCPVDAGEGTTCIEDYRVSELDSRGDNYGKIVVNGSNLGLVWGEPGTKHDFFARFPASKTDIDTTGIITGSIPQVQGFESITTSATTDTPPITTHIVKPDMNNLIMVAKVLNVEAGSKIIQNGEEVFLDFKPISTALEFTVENGFGTNNDMIVKSVGLERVTSTEACPNILWGDFKVTVKNDKDGKNNRPKTELDYSKDKSNNRVAINFSEPVTVKKGEKLNFTLFLNPGNVRDIENLKLFITFVDNDDATKAVTRKALMLKSDDTPVSFPTHKKTRIYGLVVPEAVKIIINDENVVVTPFVVEDPIDIKPL